MNHELPSPENHVHLTRRDLLKSAVLAGLGAAASLPAKAVAEPSAAPQPEPEFVPENDYPFFGAEPGPSN
ncbi:MAG TPA: hypothetical protein VGM54_15275 [Chthoniobacter sp.]|jgi:hypothetical protein